MQRRKDGVFDEQCWKPDPSLTPHAKTDSNWITVLNVPLETIKLLEYTIDSKLLDTGFWQ